MIKPMPMALKVSYPTTHYYFYIFVLPWVGSFGSWGWW